MSSKARREQKDLVREYHEVIENRDIDRVPDFYADDYTVDLGQPETGETVEGGVDDVVERIERFVTAFPDASHNEKEMVAEGDWVLCRLEVEGTHEGEFLGIEPTGKEMSMQIHESYRFENGKIVESHSTGSLTSVLAQLGVDLPIEEP